MDSPDLDVPAGFELVADETRAAILYALSRGLKEDPDDPALGFAELRRRAGVRDSGNFNYHLDRLLGRYVERGPDGEGYALTHPGMAVVASLVGGEYDLPGRLGPEPYDDPCPICGEPTEIVYEGGILRFGCDGEPAHAMGYNLPPHAVEEEALDEAAELMARRSHAEMALVFDGRCPMCVGSVEFTVSEPERADVAPGYDASCTRCGVHYQLQVGHAAIHHPEVVAFHAERGVDLRSDPTAILRLSRGEAVEVLDGDGDRFAVTVAVEGDALSVTVDDRGQVLGVAEADQ